MHRYTQVELRVRGAWPPLTKEPLGSHYSKGLHDLVSGMLSVAHPSLSLSGSATRDARPALEDGDAVTHLADVPRCQLRTRPS